MGLPTKAARAAAGKSFDAPGLASTRAAAEARDAPAIAPIVGTGAGVADATDGADAVEASAARPPVPTATD